jgi:hypothetical protein
VNGAAQPETASFTAELNVRVDLRQYEMIEHFALTSYERPLAAAKFAVQALAERSYSRLGEGKTAWS